MPKMTADEARALASEFRDLSVQLGDFRFENWGSLTPAKRREIEDAEWSLLNSSSDMITTAVGIDLTNLQNGLKAITDATAKAKKAVATINTVKDVLGVAAAAIVLAGAIASQNPNAIASAAGELFKVAKGAIG